MVEWLVANQGAAPLLSAIAALLAVILGPAIQFRIAHRQQKATILSGNRIRWIEQFRSEIAEFCACSHLHESEKYWLKIAQEQNDERQIEHYYRCMDISLMRTNILLHSIRLKLDIDSKSDLEIWNCVKKIDSMDFGDYLSIDAFEADFFPQVERLQRLTRRMLNGEWRRVERLE